MGMSNGEATSGGKAVTKLTSMELGEAGSKESSRIGTREKSLFTGTSAQSGPPPASTEQGAS
eukprot:6060864-Pleurochrysis_carterae.AAC.3